MPAAALSQGQSQVVCTDGVKGNPCAEGRWLWDNGDTFTTDEGSDTVKVEGYGVVRFEDKMEDHPDGEVCTPSPVLHAPQLDTIIGSPNVYADGKLIARVGDKFNKNTIFDHEISTGSGSVFIG